MRTAGLSILTLALVTVGVLVINGRQITQDALDRDRARSVVADWLGDDSGFAIVTVAVDDGDASIVLAGPGDPPDVETLADRLAEQLGRAVDIDLQWIPRQRVRASSSD